jgi:hypothetical protein
MTEANERFARVYGVEPALAAAGTAVEEFLDGIHVEDRERVRERIIARTYRP